MKSKRWIVILFLAACGAINYTDRSAFGITAPLFSKENYSVVDNKRVEVVRDDGRHFIRTTKEKFDVITSDPIDPWVKGCAALNTVEYYEMCKAHLNPGGVMSLWIPFYESNSDTIKSVLSTFFKVFPNGIVWSNDENGSGYDAVLFGQVEPTKIDVDQWQERLDRPENAAVKQSLEDVGFHDAVDLLAQYTPPLADNTGNNYTTYAYNRDKQLTCVTRPVERVASAMGVRPHITL